MCKFRFRFLAAFLTFGVGISILGIWRSLPAAVNLGEKDSSQPVSYSGVQLLQTEENDPFTPDETLALNCNDQQNRINYQKISFDCNPLFDPEVEVLKFSKSPLRFEDDKPDYVHPSYISFKFRNKDKKPEKEPIYIDQISIYPIEEYGRMYSVDESYGERVDNYANQ